MNTLETMEQIWNEYQVYSNDEINYIDDEMKIKFPELEDNDG